MTSRARGWLVSWAIAILWTAVLLGLMYALHRSLRTWYAGTVVISLSSIWAAWDSGRVRVQLYRTQMANEPFMILFICFLFWPIVFPWYVIIRCAIARGLVAPKKP